MAKDLDSSIASKGGRARAEKLSPEARSEIARAAAEARWEREGKTPLPRATHEGTLPFGRIELPCAVLENGTRLISERAFAGLLGAPRGGHAYSVRHAHGGAVLPVYVASERLKPFIDAELAAALSAPVPYIPRHGGRSAYGVIAEIVPKVCDVWLRAREAEVLTKRQEEIAKKAEIIVRALAHVGIVALVDEATGYQDERARDALAKILEAFITKELRKWVKTFPAEFYREMFRLRGWRYDPNSTARAPLIGKLTDNLIYQRLAPGVRDELRRVNPSDERGRRKRKHHQWLTEEIGHPKLREHLASVTTLMKISSNWQEFMKHLDKAHRKYPTYPMLPMDGL